MMNHAERVDEIVWLDRYGGGELLRIGVHESDAVGEPGDPGAFARDVQRPFRQIDRGGGRAVPREVDGVRADAATDFEHALAAPAREVGEGRNMRLDEILALLNLVEIGARSDRLVGVAQIAGAG